MSASFVHLHTHSHFSLLQALPKIPELVSAAAKDGQPALALTDTGNLYGAIEFYKAAQKKEVKPILGLDAYVAPRTRHDKEPRVDTRPARLVLLAKDNTGYQNLLKLASAGFLEGFYYKPRIDRELIAEHREGLIAILPSFASEVSRAYSDDDSERATQALRWYRDTFGEDCYIEITRHPEIPGHDELQQQLITLAHQESVPLVAAHDVYYMQPEDRIARETLLKIQSNGAVPGSEEEEAADFSFISQEQAAELFSDMPETLANTTRIAEQCNVELTLGNWVFPDLEIPDGTTYDEELRKRTYEGVEARGMERTQEVVDRIEKELDIIKTKGFSPYFMVVADLLQFARRQRILSTTRGSAAGSLVSYLNFITNVDPVYYQLPFERFLNPERPKAPDIDMDFADDRRDEVIAYAREKYGEDRVAQIGTFGTMLARGVVRDVARALGYPYGMGDRIAKQIPFGQPGAQVTVAGALEQVSELAEMYQNEDDVRQILDMAKMIEGNARHISIHAAGVVIAPSPVTDWTPIQFDPKGTGKYVTQYDMHAVEDAGLLKFDFLGIRNLSILADSVERVRQRHGTDINVENVPLDDERTFAMLARGETMGLFQLSGSGMTRYLKDLKPTNIHDINAMVALYRPGPMDYIPTYIERKHNPEKVTYLDDRLRDILHMSYGILTYQDDVLLIAVNIAGFSWLEADTLRKAMGKKIPEEMQAQKEKLVNGFIENGMSETKAHQLWAQIEPFAQYGFNKAHAASYGKVAYQTAYMKANYPVEYMAALLSAEGGDLDKVAAAVEECSRLGIAVLPPAVNESYGDFTTVTDADGNPAIRFGLYAIKNFGTGVADTIITERDRSGPFESLSDFLERVTETNLNRKQLEALIMCGALDAFEERGKLLHNIETLITHNKEAAKSGGAQTSLFAGLESSAVNTLRLADAEQTSMRQKLSWEREHLGLYVSGHPLEEHRQKLDRLAQNIHQLKTEAHEGKQTVIAGMIETTKPILTKNGDRMLFCTLQDFSDSLETVIFPNTYNEHSDTLVPESCVALKGKVSYKNGEPNFIAEQVRQL